MKIIKRGSLQHSKDTSSEAREELLRDELRTENTQALLDRLDTIVETEAIDDIELLSAILDVLDEKAPLDVSDEDLSQGLARLKADYAPIFEAGTDEEVRPAPPVKKSSGRVFKYATVTVVLCSMLLAGVVAQAAGWDIFGNFARWAGDKFNFIIASHQEVSPYYELFRQALEDEKLPGELAPAWYPADAQASDPEALSDPLGAKVYMDLMRSNGSSFKVSVELNIESTSIGSFMYEKDTSGAEPYTSNGRTFYIFDNTDTVVAIWSDDTYVELIAGDLSVAEIKKIINSIGVSEHD